MKDTAKKTNRFSDSDILAKMQLENLWRKGELQEMRVWGKRGPEKGAGQRKQLFQGELASAPTCLAATFPPHKYFRYG